MNKNVRRTWAAVLALGSALLLTVGAALLTYAGTPEIGGPVEIVWPPAVSERISAGSAHTCAVMDGDDVRCWGLNQVGQLGYGNTNDPGKGRIGDNELPVTAGAVDLGGTAASTVTAGEHHTCVILVDHTVACWGHNFGGVLGLVEDPIQYKLGDDEPPGANRVNLGANRTARQIAAGGSHTCVITDRDKVMCWGDGGLGALGYGNQDDIGDTEHPAEAGIVDLGPGRTVRDIAAGRAHTCAVMDNGDVFCWGSNRHGALGYPDPFDADGLDRDVVGDDETPATVGRVDLGSEEAVSVTAGDEFTCVQMVTMRVRCWGNGQNGRLGSGSLDSLGDDEVPNSANAGHVALGGVSAFQVEAGNSHACAGLVDDTVRCWGEGDDGRLGLGNEDDIGDDERPDDVFPVNLAREPMAAVTAGDFHTCAVNVRGRVRCWGKGDDGALGTGTPFEIGTTPATLPGMPNPISLGGLVTRPCVWLLCP